MSQGNYLSKLVHKCSGLYASLKNDSKAKSHSVMPPELLEKTRLFKRRKKTKFITKLVKKGDVLVLVFSLTGQ